MFPVIHGGKPPEFVPARLVTQTTSPPSANPQSHDRREHAGGRGGRAADQSMAPFSQRNSINFPFSSSLSPRLPRQDTKPSRQHAFLPSLQVTLADASRTLYTALDGKVFFKQVTVVVPDKWTTASCKERVGEPREGTAFQVRNTRLAQLFVI